MGLETDLLLDRRRLKRRLFFWRGLTVAAVALCALVVIGRNGLPGAHVARLTVSGIITEDRKTVEALAAVARDDTAKAVLLVIDSPGGSVAGGESLHHALARVAEKKPVVAVMTGLAASAGYMIAMPAERVFAREATLTGSIGVLLQTGEVSGLLSNLGVRTESIISGPLKDQPSFTHPLSEAGRAVLRGLVDDMYDQFVTIVARGRHMDPARVRELGDGRAYTGRQALALGLVDAIGGEADARAWLESDKGLTKGLPVRDIERPGLAGRAFGDALQDGLASIVKTVLFQGLKLDGAWALWQPASAGQ